LADLAEAKAGGNPQAIKGALDNLKTAMDRYNANDRAAANKEKEPGKREYLNNKAGQLERARHDLDNLPHNSDFDRVTDPIVPLIDDYTDTLHNTDGQNAMKGAAKAHNLAGYLRVTDEDPVDLSGPFNAAGDVTDLMRGLMGNTPGVADDLGTSNEDALNEAAQNAMELDNLLKGGVSSPPSSRNTSQPTSARSPISSA